MFGSPQRIVLAITGASGSPIALRLLSTLLTAKVEVHLTISPSGTEVLRQETGVEVNLREFQLGQLFPAGQPHIQRDAQREKAGSRRTAHGDWIHNLLKLPESADPSSLHYHHYQDFSAGIASGSFPTCGMVVCPCSMGTLAALCGGLSTNLIQRAADVHLKERRRLIVVPRETPLSLIHLENMRQLTLAGGMVLPAMPAWYQHPQEILDLIDSVVQRICDHLQIPVSLTCRWGASRQSDSAAAH